MKSVFRKLIIAGLLLFFISPAHASSRGFTIATKTSAGKVKKFRLYQNSYALVVGNGTYQKGWDPLPGALEDVGEVAETLKRTGCFGVAAGTTAPGSAAQFLNVLKGEE